MTILDEAIRAHRKCPSEYEAMREAARILLPRDPTPETVEAMARAMCLAHGIDPDAWLYNTPIWSHHTRQWRLHEKQAIAAYRAQPAWQALWGDKT